MNKIRLALQSLERRTYIHTYIHTFIHTLHTYIHTQKDRQMIFHKRRFRIQDSSKRVNPPKSRNRLLASIMYIQGVFNKLDAFTALRFMGTGAPLAAERMRILPMTHHFDNISNEGKFLPLFTDCRSCWKRRPSTRKYLSQLIVSLKHRYNNPFCTYSTPDTNFHSMA
jgi:hypothetical protein